MANGSAPTPNTSSQTKVTVNWPVIAMVVAGVAIAGVLTQAGASPNGAALIAMLVVGGGVGLWRWGLGGIGMLLGTLGVVFLTLTAIRLLWKLIVFAWN